MVERVFVSRSECEIPGLYARSSVGFWLTVEEKQMLPIRSHVYDITRDLRISSTVRLSPTSEEKSLSTPFTNLSASAVKCEPSPSHCKHTDPVSIPWNYPLLMWAWKVGPALAAGCCVIMKPSELTPLTALMLCDLAKEAGIPPGVVNTLPGLGATTGDALSRHMDIDKIAFTGSVVTGRRISIAAAESNLKKVTLELGGKSPMLVFDSADIEEAATWTALGIWFNSGQDCCASSRVLVQDTIYDKFLEALKRKAEACAIGQVIILESDTCAADQGSLMTTRHRSAL